VLGTDYAKKNAAQVTKHDGHCIPSASHSDQTIKCVQSEASSALLHLRMVSFYYFDYFCFTFV